MVLEKLHILMSLFVGLVFTVAALAVKTPLADFVTILLITMIAFYIVGLLTRSFIRKAFPAPNPPEATPTEAAEAAEPETDANAQ